MQVQLVQDQEEVGVVTFEPFLRFLEDRRLGFSVEHGAQHTDVGDQNVWRISLYVPTVR